MEASDQEIESEMSDRKDRGELSRRGPPGNDARLGGLSWRIAELGLEAGLVPFRLRLRYLFPQLVGVCARLLELAVPLL